MSELGAPEQLSFDLFASPTEESGSNPEPSALLNQRQLSFAFPRPAQSRIATFARGPSNEIALRVAASPELWPSAMAIIVGPPGAGKTRILREMRAPALWLSASDKLDGFYRPDLIPKGRMIAFDDIDKSLEGPDADEAERALQALIAMAEQRGAHILASARNAPTEWNVSASSLSTRLATAWVARIDEADIGLMEAVLADSFQIRGLAVPETLVRWLAARIAPTAGAAVEAAAKLDAASMRERRPITRTLAAQVFGFNPNDA